MPHDLTDDKSTLVQVMAWCHQATSHYLNQCWPRSPMHFSFIELCLKMLSTKWRPFVQGGDELKKKQSWSLYVPPVPRWRCSKHECQVAPQSQLVSGSHDFRSHDFRSHDFPTVAPLKLCGFLVINVFFWIQMNVNSLRSSYINMC